MIPLKHILENKHLNEKNGVLLISQEWMAREIQDSGVNIESVSFSEQLKLQLNCKIINLDNHLNSSWTEIL